jgi:hypothetical protein
MEDQECSDSYAPSEMTPRQDTRDIFTCSELFQKPIVINLLEEFRENENAEEEEEEEEEDELEEEEVEKEEEDEEEEEAAEEDEEQDLEAESDLEAEFDALPELHKPGEGFESHAFHEVGELHELYEPRASHKLQGSRVPHKLRKAREPLELHEADKDELLPSATLIISPSLVTRCRPKLQLSCLSGRCCLHLHAQKSHPSSLR